MKYRHKSIRAMLPVLTPNYVRGPIE